MKLKRESSLISLSALLVLILLKMIIMIVAYDFVVEDTDEDIGSVSWSLAYVKAYCNYVGGNPQWWYVAVAEHSHNWWIDPYWQGPYEFGGSGYDGGGLNEPAWTQTWVKIYSSLQGRWIIDSLAFAQAP